MKLFSSLRLYLLSFLLACCGTVARAEVTTIPVTIGKSGLLRIRGKVNGVATNFILDTGFTTALFINADCEGKMHFHRTDEPLTNGDLKDAKRISQAVIEIDTLGPPVIPYTLSSSVSHESYCSKQASFHDFLALEENVDGVIGMGAFADCTFDLDCKNKTLTLYKGKDIPPLTGYRRIYVANSRDNNGVVEAKLELKNPVGDLGLTSFLIDTGTNMIWLTPEQLKKLGATPVVSGSLQTIKKRVSKTMYTIKSCTLGEADRKDYLAGETYSDMSLLGMCFISQCRLILLPRPKTTAIFAFP